MRYSLLIAALSFFAQTAFAQLADVTYSVTSVSTTTYTNGCTEWDFSSYDMKAFVNSWDNVNTTPVSTGCMSCSAGTLASCNFSSNVALQTRSNNAYTISSSIDNWEDDCGNSCVFDGSSCGVGNEDDCRRQSTQNFNFRETASPSNSVQSQASWGSSASRYEWTLNYTWKYSGSANLVTPICTTQSAVASSGAIRSWSVQLDASNLYRFATCGAGEDTYLRLFAPDGYTVVASNDNNGSACSGNAASLDYTAPSTGVYYIELSKASRAPLTVNSTLYYAKITCCVTAGDCNDNNLCTTDACASGICTNSQIADCCQNDNVLQQHLAAPACGTYSAVNIAGGKYVTLDVISGETYTFSTCNSSYDTRINGYDKSGNRIFSNDNNGPECATTRASVVWTATFTDTLRVLVDSAACAVSATPAVLQYKNNLSLSITSSSSAMCPGESRTLSATPEGGTFSGSGVSGDTFTAPAGGGTITITYTFGNCSTTQNISVTNCDDNLPCTVDACNAGACTNTPFVCVDTDNDACTNVKCVNGGCNTVCANNQLPQMLWQKSYGGNSNDEAAAITRAPDGGYVMSGYAFSNNGDVSGNAGDYDFWIVKTDENGNLHWQNTFGGTLTDKAYAVHGIAGGGYIVAGETSSNNNDVSGNRGDADFWVVKLDANGNLVWQKALGGNGKEIAQSVQQTSDGGFILAGKSNSANNDEDVTGNHGDYDVWVVKLDAGGNISWQKSLGGTKADLVYTARQTPDGGYIISGETSSSDGDVTGNITNEIRPWVVKLNAAGALEWQKIYGISTTNDEHFDIAPVGNGYILSGTIGYDYWVARLDNSGNILWENYWGGSGNDFAYDVVVTNDDDFLIAGKSASNNGFVTGNHGGNDYWIIRVSETGTLLWQKSFGGSDMDDASCIIEDADGNILVAGVARSSDDDVTLQKGAGDFWLVKLTASGCVPVMNASAAICAGDSILFGNAYLKNAGVYQQTFTSANTCDSVVNLTLTIASCVSISGKIQTETGVAIPGVTVALSGDASDTLTTTADGLYSFDVVAGGDYSITPFKSNDSITNNGVTTTDIALIRRHVLGSTFLNSPYKVIAADATNNTFVTTGDIPLVRIVVLNDKAKFPGGRLWEFVSSAQSFPVPPQDEPYNPFPLVKTRTYTTISSDQPNQDFIGVKIGDVNGSWNAGIP